MTTEADDLLAALGVDADASPPPAKRPRRGRLLDLDGGTAVPETRAPPAAPTEFDAGRARPLLTALDADFPTFNSKKREAAEVGEGGAKPIRHLHNNMAGCLTWEDRMKALWDIELLSRGPASPSRVVVYAGGFPGRHVAAVASLFPETRFVAMHHQPYECGLPSNVAHKVRRFDLHEAQVLRKQNKDEEIILIADTWSPVALQADTASGDAAVISDMTQQREWVRELQPARASLKFWLPQVSIDGDAATTKSTGGYARTFGYLEGEVLLPAYGGASIQRQTRLVVTGGEGRVDPRTRLPKETDYDCLRFARQVLFFMKIARPRKYSTYHPKNPKATTQVAAAAFDGMDYKYDASAEVAALSAYLLHAGRTVDAAALGSVSAELSGLLGAHALSTHPERVPLDAPREAETSVGRAAVRPLVAVKNSAKGRASAADSYLASL
eukprot:Rhum_TRINITY_DN7597_c0_g2::Rhum_TRINITY_DN7597_c0_g2_i1::g.23661::m.23661/K18776/MTR2, MT48; cap2 methyltransferase